MAFAISLSWILILRDKKHNQLCVGETHCTWWLGSQTVVGRKQSNLKHHQEDQIKLMSTDSLLLCSVSDLKCWPSFYSSKTGEDSACFRSFQMLRIRSNSEEVSFFLPCNLSIQICTYTASTTNSFTGVAPRAPTARLQRPNPVTINLIAIQACALPGSQSDILNYDM